MFNILHSRIVQVALFAAILLLQMHLWFSPVGFTLYRQLHGKIGHVEQSNQRALLENQRLEGALDDLRRDDGKLLVNSAREHLGMVGPGETLYQVSPSTSSR